MKFGVISADPPWPYNDRKNVATRFGGGARRHYPPMKVDAIASLPLGSLCADDCVLFLWGTGPHTPSALRVIEAWGFRFCTIGFAWLKVSKQGTPRRLPGHYTASNIEMVWIGARGRFQEPAERLVDQVVPAPLSGVHSQKPEDVCERIERMYPTLPKLEMFARRHRPGWTCIGNEVDGLDISTSLQRLAKETTEYGNQTGPVGCTGSTLPI